MDAISSSALSKDMFGGTMLLYMGVLEFIVGRMGWNWFMKYPLSSRNEISALSFLDFSFFYI